MNEAHPEEHLESEMIQPVFKVRRDVQLANQEQAPV
jgi:hypothetical protein